jgi:hypothetical protein
MYCGEVIPRIIQGLEEMRRIIIIIITFTWSDPRGVSGYTEGDTGAWHICPLSLSDPSLLAV